jgi:septal ring factor EnvC (AmiA/AmiB activator)
VIELAPETWIPIVLSCLTALAAIITLAKNGKKDTAAEAIQRAKMTADIEYIRASIDEIKLENRAIKNEISELKAKVVEIEASTKSAHKRLDDLRKEHEA